MGSYRLYLLLLGTLGLLMWGTAVAATPTMQPMRMPYSTPCMTGQAILNSWTLPPPPQPVPPPVRHVKPKPHMVIPQGRLFTVWASAYALYGRTSRGTRVCQGTIAVDPRIIPYGSKIYVPGYGWGTALDCGGAILGSRIDLWMPSNSACYNWGVRKVTIRVLPPQK
ncbi:MAG: 3D domain-containing protein [Candidatus Xenobia bacterium]